METGQVWTIDGSSATIKAVNGPWGGVFVFQTFGRIGSNSNAPHGNVTCQEEIIVVIMMAMIMIIYYYY